MAGAIGWWSETLDLFSACVVDARGTTHRLVVEALPDGGWDWLAWCGETGRCLGYGAAATKAGAMQAAEMRVTLRCDLLALCVHCA